jgi:hypothetical protein
MRFVELHRHQNSNPWDGNPFYDIYTDRGAEISMLTMNNSIKNPASLSNHSNLLLTLKTNSHTKALFFLLV